MYDDFVGITQHVDYLIERNRITPGDPWFSAVLTVFGSRGSAGHVMPNVVSRRDVRIHFAVSTATAWPSTGR